MAGVRGTRRGGTAGRPLLKMPRLGRRTKPRSKPGRARGEDPPPGPLRRGGGKGLRGPVPNWSMTWGAQIHKGRIYTSDLNWGLWIAELREGGRPVS